MKFSRYLNKLLAVVLLCTLLAVGTAASAEGGIYDGGDLFTSRDLEQAADLTDATSITLTDGADVNITEAGVYIISGTAANATIRVEADSEAKVQLVLDGANITNDSAPCVYVVEADKVFVTTTGDSSLSVTGAFDSDTNVDAVIFSKSDLVLNGTATLMIASSDNGVSCKDDLKITGGAYAITAASKAIEAHDSIRVSDGVFTLTAGMDGLHAENSDDETLGYIYIGGGTFEINAGDDAIHALSVAQIDGGTFDIIAAEGIEATYIQINGGTMNIRATDDGINAAQKSSVYTATLEINGGEITVDMGSGDTDAIDSNGNIIVNGGTINVTGSSSFDYDGSAQYNGGTIIVNGQQVDSIPNQMMGGMAGMNGPGNGAFPGDMGGMDSSGTGGPGGMGGRGGMGGPGGR